MESEAFISADTNSSESKGVGGTGYRGMGWCICPLGTEYNGEGWGSTNEGEDSRGGGGEGCEGIGGPMGVDINCNKVFETISIIFMNLDKGFVKHP